MTKFEVLLNVFPVYAYECNVENEYEKGGIAALLEEYYDRGAFKPFTVDECLNAFIDDADEVYMFEKYYYMIIGTTLICLFASEYGTYFDLRKEAYINISRVASYAKRIK